MTSPNRPSWKPWGDHPTVVSLVVISTILSIVVFLTGKSSLPDILGWGTSTATPVTEPTSTSVSGSTETAQAIPSVVSQESINMSGRWAGVFTTAGGTRYDYELDLYQEGYSVSGTTLAKKQTNSNIYSQVKLRGIILNSNFQFEEYEIIGGPRDIVCFITAFLTYEKREELEQLRGSWNGPPGESGCQGSGTIELYKQP